MPPIIRSPQNSTYKQWRRWVARPEEERCPVLPVEGWKQVGELCRRMPPEQLVTSDPERACREGMVPGRFPMAQISPSLMERLSPLRTPQGIIGFFPKPNWQLSDLTGRLLYLAGLQDPGNLGTLIRTAAATGCFSMAASRGTVSPFNSKVIRSSSTYLFQVPFLAPMPLTSTAFSDYEIWVLDPREGESPDRVRFGAKLLLLLGSEAHGPGVNSSRYRRIKIPMEKGVDSLNAAVAGSLLMYEVYLRGKR